MNDIAPRAVPGRPRPHRGPDVGRPKGRPLDPAALDEVRSRLGDQPRRRDLLIEHLHRLQDHFGALRHAHLVALAHEMKLAMAEVYEVATFYAHFDVIEDDAPAPPPLTVRVCDGVVCALRGGERLAADLAGRVGPGVRVVAAPCIGRCDRAPAAMIGRNGHGPATIDSVEREVAEGRSEPERSAPDCDLDAYRRGGGYRLLRDVRAGRRAAESIIAAIDASGLRGLGGAGFPVGWKWRAVRQEPGPRLLAVNADEGEPGTFKDRVVLESDPHRFLEGMLIAAWAIEAEEVYLYLRDEYPQAREILLRELSRLEAEGVSPPVAIHLRRGAGAYICGEETAMLESIEGKRGYPRHKPPFPTQRGLFGRPTLIHNVETLWWVRDIVERGPEWFSGQGRNGRSGMRHFSVSGRVKRPGVVRAPAGTTARELIAECGGMEEGHAFKAYLPGGASGGILPAALGDVPLDFGTVEPHGGFLGSAAVVVFSDRDNMADVARNLMRFFAHESCGQCTPCRVGTEKAATLIGRAAWDAPLLTELAGAMRDASICGLGQAAPNPMLAVLRYFPEDLR